MADGMSTDRRALGAALRELRQRRGTSQARLAAESGIHRSYLGGIERGTRNPTYLSMVRVAEALGTTVSKWLALAERHRQD